MEQTREGSRILFSRMTMRAKLLIPGLAAALLLLAACDIEDFGSMTRVSRDFHYSYPLKQGGRLSLETFNGSVDISTWDQDTVDVSGTKTGPSEDALEALKINVDHDADSVSVRAVRPVERRNNLGARFVIKVPRNTAYDRIVTSNGPIHVQDGIGPAKLRSSNGAIRIHSLHGSLDAQTSNGPIDLDDLDGDATLHSSNGHIHVEHISGALEASTSNNGIRAEIDRPGHNVRVDSSNGSIDLTLPAGLSSGVRASTSNNSITVHMPIETNAHLIANTSNSSIESDFDMQVRGEIRRHHIDGNLGSGGPTIDLSTSNGAIRLLKVGQALRPAQ
jgi:DUF4097 and DUF4098 domain-containing protein YvlB